MCKQNIASSYVNITVDQWISSLLYQFKIKMSNILQNLQQQNGETKLNNDESYTRKSKLHIKEGQLRALYLIVFNIVQTIGFVYVLYIMGVLYKKLGYASFAIIYDQLGLAVKLLHVMQILEVIHPIVGFTKGGPTVPFFQLLGRLFILFMMLDEPRMQTKPVVPYLFMVWGTIEVIRHAYYVSQLLNKEISLLTWLRYSAWMLLYPMGIFGEATVMIKNLPYLQETMRFTIIMPNTWNMSFDTIFLLKLQIFALVCPIMYMLTSHMYRMRVKKMADFTFTPIFTKTLTT